MTDYFDFEEHLNQPGTDDRIAWLDAQQRASAITTYEDAQRSARMADMTGDDQLLQAITDHVRQKGWA